jgi:hypothetical protein
MRTYSCTTSASKNTESELPVALYLSIGMQAHAMLVQSFTDGAAEHAVMSERLHYSDSSRV